MTSLKSNTFIERGITLGIPLLVIAAAAMSLGIDVGSWTCIAMAALASVLQTIFTYFVLEPRREKFEADGALGSYYNYWAAASTLASLAAVSIVFAFV